MPPVKKMTQEELALKLQNDYGIKAATIADINDKAERIKRIIYKSLPLLHKKTDPVTEKLFTVTLLTAMRAVDDLAGAMKPLAAAMLPELLQLKEPDNDEIAAINGTYYGDKNIAKRRAYLRAKKCH